MEYGRTPSQASRTTSELLSKDVIEKAACILAWALTRSSQALISNAQLKALHNEIESYAEMVGATELEVGAVSGTLWCRSKSRSVSAEDSAVRLGQLLCRWAAEQEPEIGLRVGVHTGELRAIELSGTHHLGYFGKAVSTARLLAEIAPRETCVHFLPATKKSLRVFERVTFSVWWNRFRTPATDSYYLDPWTESITEDAQDMHTMWASEAEKGYRRMTTSTVMKIPVSGAQSSFSTDAIAKMTADQFERWLASYGVAVAQFGRGQAKTVTEFHKEIAQERKSYLIDKNGTLERRLELVRINLAAKDSSGEDRNLKLAMEVLDDGRTRPRNQKLAVVVPEGESWREAVERTFQERFQLTPTLQQQLFSVEGNWFKEERVISPSIPGITTTYLTHEVRIRVVNPRREELKAVGLPAMKNFTTTGETSKRSHWTWAAPGDETSNADLLAQLLQDHGISMEEFEPGAFSDLVEEVYESKASTLSVRNGELMRDLQIVKVWLSADILSVPHLLVTTLKVQRGKRDEKVKDCPISMRMVHGQGWQEALTIALMQRLGLELEFQATKVAIDQNSYRLCEEIEYSKSFPGLKTVYRIHEVTCRITEPHRLLGLPEGNDFVFSRVERSKDGTEDIISTYFSWRPRKGRGPTARRSSTAADPDDDKAVAGEAEDPKRRLPAPAALTVPSSASSSALVVEELMRGKKTDWVRARNAARRIRDKAYTCQNFFEDCKAAFPELGLYVVGDGAQTTSGRSADDEYQRTVGALFAVYWLMRLDSDGAQSFAFGVSDNWEPLSGTSPRPRRNPEELKKRSLFLEQVSWPLFQQVLEAAGLLRGGGGACEHDEERTLAMLVLTAIHDIMKVQLLLPTVDRQGPFCGYKPGTVIHDHDTALGYVLDRYPDALPSFAGLPKEQREVVKFTQCNMEYNMGWLVQAEAPPGALFTKFKEAIRSGKASPGDVAFYFTHWLTDLAGAEPFPQEGCEKFVLKFPQKVLVSFLNSFPFVNHLSTKSETRVFEDYLEWRWDTHDPELGPKPLGSGSIAKLRLVVMAQGNSLRVLEALEELPQEDRGVLEDELARTGCRNQAYTRDGLISQAGPAFLVYYGPALLQKNCGADPVGALAVLAEVMRQSRALWPLEADRGDETVTVQIDCLKEMEVQSLQELQPGEFWVLQRVNDKSAQVKRLSLVTLAGNGAQQVDWSSQRILNFGTGALKAQFNSPGNEQEMLRQYAAMVGLPNQVQIEGAQRRCGCGWQCRGCAEGAPGNSNSSTWSPFQLVYCL